jgi:peptidoglycan/LPS O-acetylase OafA/YrhL
MIPKKEKEHIYGLDGLRFFSFLIVVINHVYAYLEYYGFPHHKPPYVISIGVFAIQYFFAGSGFLITYILFAEKENTGTFHLGRFYMRRILRIWPGYYVLLLLTYLLVYNIDFFILPSLYSTMLPLRMDTMLLYFLFLPQIITFFNYAPGAYLGHTYTIGIEEQFYGIWALVFKFFYRYFITILVALFVLGVVLQFFICIYSQNMLTIPVLPLFVWALFYVCF